MKLEVRTGYDQKQWRRIEYRVFSIKLIEQLRSAHEEGC